MSRARVPLHRRLLFSLLMTVALLGAFELTLRLAMGPPPPAVQVHSANMDLDELFQVQGIQARTTYQSAMPTPPFAVSPRGSRVMVLGGSSVHGGSTGIDTAGEFPARIGQKLGREVLNLGNPALDSFDLVRITEQALAFSPDVVVVYAGHNDLGNAFFRARFAGRAGGAKAQLTRLFEHLQLYVQLRRAMAPIEGIRSTLPPLTRETGAALTPEARLATLRYFEQNLTRIAYLTAEADVDLVLAVPISDASAVPLTPCAGEDPECPGRMHKRARALENTDPASAEVLFIRARDEDPSTIRATTAVEDAVRRVAANTHAVLVDTPKLVEHAPGTSLPSRTLFNDEVHFNARGHGELARVIAPVVGQRLLERER